MEKSTIDNNLSDAHGGGMDALANGESLTRVREERGQTDN
jgi:hypothetical protein